MARAPIDYTMNVINPVKAAMEGYSLGLRELQAEKQEKRDLEVFGMQKERFEMQKQAANELRASNQMGAQRKEDFYNDFTRVVNGGMSRRELISKYPDFAQVMKQTFELIPDEARANRISLGKNIQAALKNNRVDIANDLIDKQILAAQNTPGQEALASQLIEMQSQISRNPKLVFDQIGIQLDAAGSESMEWTEPDKPAEILLLEWRAKQAGLVEGTPEYQAFMLRGGKSLPNGMTIRVNPDGGVQIVEGPGVGGGGFGKKPPGYVYTTNPETNEVIARPIAGTPAARESQEARSSLQARINTAENMLNTIENLVGRPAGNGLTAIKEPKALSGILGFIEGRIPAKTQEQADLMAIYEQVTGRAFLEAFETLKGGGQITETEGVKATQALARLQRTQSPEAFKASLYEFSNIVRQNLIRSQNELTTIPEIVPAPTGGGQPEIGAASSSGEFIQMDVEQLLTVDVSTLTDAQLDAYSARMTELGF